MDKTQIIEKISGAVAQAGCFLVEVKVSKDNDVLVVIEKETGAVDLDDCMQVNDAFLAVFDKDVEDYALTVSSAGLDQPFKVPAQFRKALRSSVEVCLKGGRKLTGTLLEADGERILLRHVTRETEPGGKKKHLVTRETSFPMEEVNSVKPHITFEQ